MLKTTSVLYVVIAIVLLRLYRVIRIFRAAKGIPSLICLFAPLSPIGSTLPTSWWNPGLYFVWDWKDLYQKRGSEIISIVPLIYGDPSLYTNSPEVLKQVLGFESTFQKPEMALTLNILGPNIVASYGEQWRRHRKVTAPAFNQNTFCNVWKETAGIYKDMINAEGWNTADMFVCKSFNYFTTKIALMVISACGFGIRLPWKNPPVNEENISVPEMVLMVASSVIIRIITPRWAYNLPIARLRKVENAYIQFEHFMKNHIASRKSAVRKQLALGDVRPALDDDDNLFTRLVWASETEKPYGLDDRELLGNYFIFLLAGHETTAHTLVVTLALLGIHQDEQNRISEHIQSVSEPGTEISFDDINNFSPIVSCLYEALRLYPAAYVTIRVATEDTLITYPSITRYGTDEKVLVPKGTQIAMDLVGANRNPRHFPEPDLFKPSRWDKSLDAAISFSQGPRVCLGKRFATTEAICLLSHILRDWKVDIILNEGESPTQWQSRILYPKMGVTITTGDVPLRFTRRCVVV